MWKRSGLKGSEGITRQGGMMRLLLTAAVFFFLFIFTPAYGDQGEQEITIFKDPKPNCEEKVFVELKKVGEVDDAGENNEFLVAPWSVVADGSGNIFVYDTMMKKIYKYSKELKLLTTFGGPGGGPGEFGISAGMGGRIYLYLAKDNLLYAGDRMNQKIICFDTSGRLVKEVKIVIKANSFIVPVVDGKGNYYIHSPVEGIIDVFNPEGKKTSSLLDRSELPFGLFFSLKRRVMKEYHYWKSGPANVLHEIIDGDRLLVYLNASSFFYIVQGNNVIKKMKLWPREALRFYKVDYKEALERVPGIEGFISFFCWLMVDRDNGKYVYFLFGKPLDDDKTYIYQFDLEGNLIKVLFIKELSNDHITIVRYKRNGLFYAVGRDEDYNKTIMIYKEENR